MDHLLVHPPFADPTQPYLSLPTLKGALRERGLDARVVDLNLEAAHWLFDHETLRDLARRIGSRFVDMNRMQALDFDEQREFRQIVAARPAIEHAIGADPSPVTVFQTRELFFDASRYALARRQAEMAFEALSAAHYPYKFGFNVASHGVLPWSFDLLEEYCGERKSPLHAFYEKWFAPASDWDWDLGTQPNCDLDETAFIGVSVVFPSQVPEALYLCRFLKARAPHAFVALGGPGLHQVAIHLEPDAQKRLLAFADGIGLFEGEETLAQLFPRLDAWRAAESAALRFEIVRDVPNLMSLDPSTELPHVGPRWSLDLQSASPPDYSDLDLDRYWAPSRTILYAPTRGCYWGKCSFCYYGLAETATASYREIPPEKAAMELGQLSRRYGVKNVYISCDVLSPKYAVRLAQALIDKGVKIRWSSDLKIEPFFTQERCKLLFDSGLRSAAFGIESGSDRILELMRKGCDRATMTTVNRAFHAAGVATEWMTFTDHPDESVEEALGTVRWIEEEQDFVDLFIVGQFGLEAGSHIAQDPMRYGVRRIWYAAGDDLKLYALFQHKNGRRTVDTNAEVEREIDRVASQWELHPYPWAGANSTHHTFLHFLEYGQRVFRSHFQRAGAATKGALATPPVAHIAGMREKPRFDILRIAELEREFFGAYLPRAMYTTVPRKRSGSDAIDEVSPMSAEDYAAAASEAPTLKSGFQR
jgi:hypothetical protein